LSGEVLDELRLQGGDLEEGFLGGSGEVLGKVKEGRSRAGVWKEDWGEEG
jgi:hypothetical protein